MIDAELCAAMDRIAGQRPLLVVTDFDGTVSDFADDPSEAALREDARQALWALSAVDGLRVTVMSGRGYANLDARVRGGDRIRLVGSHGAEYTGPAEADVAVTRDSLVAELRALIEPYPGAHLEIKPVSASVHTRRMPDREAAQRLSDATVTGPGSVAGRHLKAGKEVIEIAVVQADKGVALRRLAEEVGAAAVVYLGDDRTDEDAFAVLGPADLGVKVGPGPTVAAYRVPDPVGAVAVLAGLADRAGQS